LKNILLTGSSGFIGRNIFNSFLFQKYKIFMPRHIELDVMDSITDYVKEHKIDYILHAAVSPGNRNSPIQNVWYINTAMTGNIVRCANIVEKILFFSSGSVYGDNTYKAKEDNLPWNMSIRGATKRYEDSFVSDCTNMYSMRLFGVYGPYEDYTIRFISNMICKALHGLPMTIKQDRNFDYVYIQDIMQIIDLFLESPPKDHIMNITPNDSISLFEIAMMVRTFCGRGPEIPILIKNSQGKGIEYSGDNSLFRENYPDFKFTPLEEGIKKLVAFYQNIIPIIDKKKLMEDI
jgi:GDP-L-fucose synthase